MSQSELNRYGVVAVGKETCRTFVNCKWEKARREMGNQLRSTFDDHSSLLTHPLPRYSGEVVGSSL